jgi:hypothetical protein
MAMQDGWSYCNKCGALFYDGYPTKGHCAAGGSHHNGGANAYVLPHDMPDPPPTSQDSWRFCQRCSAIYYDGYPDKGHCAGAMAVSDTATEHATNPFEAAISAGQEQRVSESSHFPGSAPTHTAPPPIPPVQGHEVRIGHLAAGFDFILPHDVDVTATAEDAWRFCHKCNVLFYDGRPDKGHCISGGGHDAAGFNFVLPHDLAPTLEFDFNPVEFGEGIAAGGSAHLTLRPDGSFTFFGHLHDSGGVEYNVAVVWAVKDSQNQAYTFQHSGHINGTFESGSRDDDWRIDSHDDNIANNWISLAAGATSHSVASARGDLAGLTNNLIGAIGLVIGI